ncbi:VCBS repeat-containing protein [Fodinibius sediminis]|uniref:Repeat domain-containing protein n=1 Tax=Fodinibius sediminis TaxID=1214077 RepID=A0A521DJL4_9BACT|nr:VCBS repeat-containing protein [Fodinibius sediminis]SMO71291.1 Repeat domain-containing protein [Fodinibius sediminis]
MIYRFLTLALALMVVPTSSRGQSDSKAAPPRLKLLDPSATNVQFSNNIPESKHLNILTYEYLHNGGGVATGDLDNDGLADIYFTGNFVKNRLYKNNGNMRFEEVAAEAGILGSQGWDTGVSMVDINNDGYLDIYVCRSGPLEPELRANELYINNGNMTFTERAAEYGLDDRGYATQAAFLDYNGDGLLDMYLLNHNIRQMESFNPAEVVGQRDPYVGDKLYKNTGNGFVDVSEEAGIIGNPVGYGLGIAIGDLNNNGRPDIYVGNDFLERDYLYINNGDGTFTEKLKKAMPHIVQFSMGNDIADFNNDGWLDILAADMIAEGNYRQKTNMTGMDPTTFGYMVEDGFHYQYMSNTLQLNNGRAVFSDVGQLAGISNTDWSWAALMADFDNDRLKDIFIANGYYKEVADKDYDRYENKILDRVRAEEDLSILDFMPKLLARIPSTPISNYIFRNNGDLTFTKKNAAWGMDHPGFSTGAAYADLNNDGALDLVITNVNDKPYIYRNTAAAGRHYLRIKLDGPSNNRSGLGSRVTVYSGGEQQMIEHYLNRGFQSSMEDVVHFGLGNHLQADSAVVRWPDGKQQTIYNIAADQTKVLNYGDASHPVEKQKQQQEPLFSDITRQADLSYQHQENAYDDFAKEPLLPHKMSNFGPGIAVGDVNADGLDDFFVGGAHEQSGTLYIQNEEVSFSPAESQPWRFDSRSEDMEAAFFDADGDGSLDLYVVSGGSEFDPHSPELQDRLYLNDGEGNFEKSSAALPEMLTSGSVVAPGDFNDDGQTDLFVGGRLIPGRYPSPPRSYILKNDGGTFIDVTDEIAPDLHEAGMVTDAIWSDYNGDKQVDLMVVGEWMSILVMENEEGVFINKTSEAGLSDTNGWWFSIAEAGINEHGNMDYIGGNLGLNYTFRTSKKEPFQLFSGDFNEDGRQEIVMGYYNGGHLYPRRGKEIMQQQFPFIKKKFTTFDAYGRATLDDIFGQQKLSEALNYKARTFASSYLENGENGRFTVSPLPNMAQLSSVNGILTEDFNGDNRTDVVIAGNLYSSETHIPRNDASIGLFLARNEDGSLRSIPARESGLYAGGDVKDLERIRLGRNGERGILIAKNDDYLQLVKVNAEPRSSGRD